LIRITLDSGVYGYGEVSATRNWSGEDADTAEHFVRDVIAPRLVGENINPVQRLTTIINSAVAGNPFTKAGVNTALWDVLGRMLCFPVATLLGGIHRVQVPVKISLSGDNERLLQCYEAAYAKGFRAFKVKVGRGVSGDVDRVRLARDTVGPDVFLGVDANGGWSHREAIQVIPHLLDAGVGFLEQPLSPDDLGGARALRKFGIPVVADETVYSLGDLVKALRADACDGVSLYVGKSGSLEGMLQSAIVAAAFGQAVVVGSNAEMGVGAAAMIHVAAACPNLGFIPSDIIGHHFYERDILEKPLDIDGQFARLPAGPGLGVEVAEDIRSKFK